MSQTEFMPILFKVLFGFVILNMVVNFILLAIHQKRLYKLLCWFWPSVLITFVLQGMAQNEPFLIALAYSATLLPMTIFAMIGLEAVGRRLPLKPFLALYAVSFPAMFLLYEFGASFTKYAMPFAVATAAPLVYTWWHLLVVDRKKTTKLQKLLGIILFIMPIHCINFAIFRMDQETQLWGWIVAYALYDTLAILLPSIALEEAKIQEKERLQQKVDEKTAELRRSLRDNESLLKVLLHDIANPLMVIKYYSDMIINEKNFDERMPKIIKSAKAMEDIINQVKQHYLVQQKRYTLPLSPVGVEECFQEVSFIFAPSMEKKRVALKFKNELSPTTKVLADKASLTHSVLSNLISNGLKFSSPDSEIEVTAREDAGSVILEIQDQGPGIPQEVIDCLMSGSEVLSSEGTAGETGNGIGLSIVKSFVESYGGEIDFTSAQLASRENSRGANIRISLDRA